MSSIIESGAPDYAAIKTRQQATWASADFGQIGTRLQVVGETLCEAVDLRSSDDILDVAGGNGNAALAAARRTQADGLPMVTQVADAENLPFEDGSFDAVLSTFGVMFTPDQGRAAMEMVRGHPARGPDRASQLDAGGVHRGVVPPDRAVRAAAGRPRATIRLGHQDAPGGREGLVVPGECLEVVIQRA